MCHASWVVVLRSGWHSCEQYLPWQSLPRSERQRRIAIGRRLRLDAEVRLSGAEDPVSGERRSGLDGRPTVAVNGPDSTWEAS